MTNNMIKWLELDEYIKFEYIAHNKSCKITYNGKFEVSIKL